MTGSAWCRPGLILIACLITGVGTASPDTPHAIGVAAMSASLSGVSPIVNPYGGVHPASMSIERMLDRNG